MKSQISVPTLDAIYNFDAIFESFEIARDQDAPRAPIAYRLLAGNDRYAAQGWVTAEQVKCPADHVPKAHVTMVLTPAAHVDAYLLVAALPDPAVEVLPQLPEDLSPIEGVVLRAGMIVNEIQALPLRRFINDVFSLRDACFNFWQCPASMAHHHAYRGGLAEHSVEVAELVADCRKLGGTERDIGIAYALLHDIGKLWSYTENARLNSRAQKLGHEIVCLDKLRGALTTLERDWEDASTALRSLLAGLWKRSGNRPLMAVGQVVRAFDQMSAERERTHSAPSGEKPWRPVPWTPSEAANEG